MLLFDVESFVKHFCMFYFPPKLLGLDIFNSLCCRVRLRQCNKAAIFQIKLVPYKCLYIVNICASQRILTNKMQNLLGLLYFCVSIIFNIVFRVDFSLVSGSPPYLVNMINFEIVLGSPPYFVDMAVDEPTVVRLLPLSDRFPCK